MSDPGPVGHLQGLGHCITVLAKAKEVGGGVFVAVIVLAVAAEATSSSSGGGALVLGLRPGSCMVKGTIGSGEKGLGLLSWSMGYDNRPEVGKVLDG